MTREKEIQIRSITNTLETRTNEDGELYLEGYFAVFNTLTELWPGAYEEINPKAFDKTLGNDIRALINHNTEMVIGRNKANTLKLKPDSHGLWGKIKINQKDTDAMNAYARVERGDISGNSFGFNILAEETEYRDDGTVKWRINEIDLHEVSVVTFPQYPETNIQARKKEVEQHKERQLELRKSKVKERLDNVKAINVTEKDTNI